MHKKRCLPLFCLVLLLGASVLFGASARQANSDWEAYDTAEKLTIEAPLKQIRYRRAQTEVRVDYQGREWRVILGASSLLLSRGVIRNDLRPGRSVTLVGSPRKDGSAEMRADRLILDGRTLELH